MWKSRDPVSGKEEMRGHGDIPKFKYHDRKKL